MSVKLTDVERALLAFLNEQDGYQVNTWAIHAGDPFRKGIDLQSLKRRGLVDAEGRGMGRQWWITDAGKEALSA